MNNVDPRYLLLITQQHFKSDPITKYYIQPLEQRGVSSAFMTTGKLWTNTKGTATAKEMDFDLKNWLKKADDAGITTLLVASAKHFTKLTKCKKASTRFGYIDKCVYPGYEHMNVILAMNYMALFYQSNKQENFDLALDTLAAFHSNNYTEKSVGDILQDVSYPDTLDAIQAGLEHLHEYEEITCDIETHGLRFETAGIISIAFGMDEHSAICFCVDRTDAHNTTFEVIIEELEKFFREYEGKIYFHNALFDVKILIYVIFMRNQYHNWEGMLDGLEVFKYCHDTQLITYLATNNTCQNVLGLKENVLEYIGDYAEDNIAQPELIETPNLLQYNALDAVGTFYLRNKYYTEVFGDEQLSDFYWNIGQPSLIVSIKMMLVGLPLNRNTVINHKENMSRQLRDHTRALIHNPFIKLAQLITNEIAWEKANAKLKKKFRPLSEFDEPFNVNSPFHLRRLLFDVLKLPVLDHTPGGDPTTGVDTLTKLKNHTQSDDIKEILDHLININQIGKITGTFLSAFENLGIDHHNWFWINGNLKTTGTQSGRYSSSEPNLQNLPSGSKYGEAIKECIEAPPGWLIAGADFSSLEDRINAILTQDPAKIKVYTDGFDGHCLRAFAYFKDQMPDIIDTVESINSIAEKYKKLRSKSKQPTFALQYDGTWHTLVKRGGFSPADAKAIEANYHELYKVSAEWAKENIKRASQQGYVNLAFGLKLKTPILAKTVVGSSQTPYEAQAEGRSANNAITQSWGLLTNRAVIEFEERLSKSDYQFDIFICNVIHDAIYLIVRDDPKVIHWLNINLIECMEWNDHELIRSTEVPMVAELDIGKNLAKQITLPNRLSITEIEEALHEHFNLDNSVSK